MEMGWGSYSGPTALVIDSYPRRQAPGFLLSCLGLYPFHSHPRHPNGQSPPSPALPGTLRPTIGHSPTPVLKPDWPYWPSARPPHLRGNMLALGRETSLGFVLSFTSFSQSASPEL